ncbi:MBL fold metallo-hydrolase [Crocosphaera sp. XPORK-15E]|uniref:MBL fold metallo-hydrolase n=1 Tax=Crocosphaera sp. XPORK-15E TaxID=3110247 RepID=UPI002B21D0BB|nr:MBL fold metallo-hydrolase [Crocosphaera sp. XPORK-15E]MEA5535116.1 MBL fold metallo-hydrolase [Crocosphaera sp. XPORK-15E]
MNPKTVKASKPPRLLLEGLFAFPPNREILGGTAYLIVEKAGNVLIDCPFLDEDNYSFLQQHGGVKCLFITHRGGIGQSVKNWQKRLNCEVVIQEQEAYLLPEVPVTTFETEIVLGDNISGIWTPGHSPGSSCVYWQHHQGVLFTGRHLLPDNQGQITPLRLAKTFHWFRQLQSVAQLRDRFSAETLNYLCPGANTGFLRGKGLIDHTYQHLSALDLEQLRQQPTRF